MKQFEHWNSPIYFENGKSLLFTADYVLLFDSLGKHETEITVKAIDPEVVNGQASWSAHGPVANVQKVKPTTIEEHQLLLFIADKLGDTTVEPTRWPVQ